MHRFAFKLEKILELRRHAEREWEIRLGEVTGRIVSAENEIAQWGTRRRSTSRIAVVAGSVDMDLLYSREEYLLLVDQRVRQLQVRVAAMEVEREKVRVGYLDASRKRKALSKLRERREQSYYSLARRQEVHVLDEIGGDQAVRRLHEREDNDV